MPLAFFHYTVDEVSTCTVSTRVLRIFTVLTDVRSNPYGFKKKIKKLFVYFTTQSPWVKYQNGICWNHLSSIIWRLHEWWDWPSLKFWIILIIIIMHYMCILCTIHASKLGDRFMIDSFLPVISYWTTGHVFSMGWLCEQKSTITMLGAMCVLDSECARCQEV